MKHLLVTGGAGFIGSNFVHYMLERYPDYTITVYDKLTYAGNLDNLRDVAADRRYAFVEGDICDAERVRAAIRERGIDTIVNFAAETHVDRSLTDPGSFIMTDVFGTYVLLEAAKDLGLERYHQVSTDEVYGQVLTGSSVETDRIEAESPYSASKAGGDLMVLAYYTSFGLPVTITRGSNNIGPYQYPEKVVPVFITNAMDDKPLPLYGDGRQMRDYQYVLDHCEASTWCCTWRPGRGLSPGHRRRDPQYRHVPRHPGPAPQAGQYDPARGRPAGPRPALFPARGQDRRLGLALAAYLRPGHRGHGALVRGQ
jgi:dTDP-glucose 4,6-dehydratase